jgi:hypothetical protein
MAGVTSLHSLAKNPNSDQVNINFQSRKRPFHCHLSSPNAEYTMLEVFLYKKYKERKRAKQLREANAKEALSKEDEEFIRESIDTSQEPSKPMGRIKFFSKKKKSPKIDTPTAEELAAVQTGEGIIISVLDGADL